MLQRVFWVLSCLLIFNLSAQAQDPLASVKDKIKNERLEEAKSELSTIIASKPKNLDECYYWQGIINFQQGNYTAAQTSFQAGLKAKGKSPFANCGMGLLKIQEGDMVAGNEFLTNATTYNKGKSIEAEFEAAKAYLTGGPDEIAQAKVILYQIRDKNPDIPETYIRLGDYYMAQNVPELAIEEFEKAKQKDPSYVPAYVALAELYYNQREFGKGFENVQEAIRLDDKYGPAYRIRGELYLLASSQQIPDKLERARDDLQKYVALAQSDLKARIRYASFLFLTEDYEEMISELDAIAKEGENTRVMERLRGMAYNKLGQYDKAKQAMDSYFERSDEKYTISQDYETYANILRNEGKFEESVEYYDKAIAKAAEKGNDMEGLYESIADEYAREAESRIKASREVKDEGKSKLKEASQRVLQYNNMVAQAKELVATDPEKAKQLAEEAKTILATVETLQAEAEAKNKEASAKEDEAKEFYPKEAFFRAVVVKKDEENDRKSLQSYYKLAKAQYYSGMLREADQSFIEVSKLKADYSPPYSYRMRIANQLERVDTATMEWFLKPVAEDISSAYGEKEEWSKSEKQLLLTAYEIMAQYNFNPSSEDGDYHCADAKPFIEKIYAIDPNYSRIQQLAEFCESQGGR
jgi:tetratricopeptide (TPR) repeat protein